MNNIVLNEELRIENMIYEIRGKQVMLYSKIFATKWHELFIKKGMINNE